MDETPTNKSCPECGSDKYRFHSRTRVADESGNGEVTETKSKCQACGHEWRVRGEAANQGMMP